MSKEQNWVEIDLNSDAYERREVVSHFSSEDVNTDRGARMLERMQRPLPAREIEHALRRSRIYGF